MSHGNSGSDRRHVLAACAVALATAVSSGATAAAADAGALEKLERYCTSSWRNAGIRRQDWEDCTQQTLLELISVLPRAGLEAAVNDRESPERRELNRAVWRLVQRCRRSPRHEPYDDRFISVGAGTGRPLEKGAAAARGADWEVVMGMARAILSDRQVEILELTREGWRVAEIGERLGISAARVSDEKYKAIGRIRERLAT